MKLPKDIRNAVAYASSQLKLSEHATDIIVTAKGSGYVLTFVDHRASEIIRMPFDATPEAARKKHRAGQQRAHHHETLLYPFRGPGLEKADST